MKKIKETIWGALRSLFGNSVNVTVEKGAYLQTGDIVAGNKSIEGIEYTKFTGKFTPNLPNNIQKDSLTDDIHRIKEPSSEFEKIIADAEEIQSQRKYQEATEIYFDLLSQNPPPIIEYLANVNLAICYLNSTSLDSYKELAEKYIARAVNLSQYGQEEKIHLVKAWYALDSKDYTSAREHVDTALQINPKYLKAIDLQSLLRDRSGEDPHSILSDTYLDTYGELQECFAEKSSSLGTIGQLYLRCSEFDQAIHYFLLANKIKPNNIYVVSMLGDAYLFKALSNAENNDITIAEVEYKNLNTAIQYYEEALSASDNSQIPRDLKPFVINYAAALFYMGDYAEATKKVQKAIDFGVEHDQLYLTKARIETATGDYSSAYNSFKKISDEKLYFEQVFIFLAQKKYDSAISYLSGLLSSHETASDVKDMCNEVLVDIYTFNDQFEQAFELLTAIHRNGKSSWRTRLVWAKYYEHSHEFENADDSINRALAESNYHPHAVVDSIEYFGRNSRFHDIVKLLQDVLAKCNVTHHSYLKFTHLHLAKAYYFNEQFFEAIEAVKQGKDELEINDDALLNILADSYFRAGNYSKSQQILKKIYDSDPADYQNIINLGNILVRIGQVEDGISYLEKALQMPQGESDSTLMISLSQAFMLTGDCHKALDLAERAKDLDKDKPIAQSHPYYMNIAIRCGATDSSVKHMAEYHACYPRQEIVREITAIEHDDQGQEVLTSEFLEFMNNSSERFNKILNLYKATNVPLALVAHQYRAPINEIYNWRNIYDIKININSGNIEDVELDLKEALKFNKITIDFLGLLILARIDMLDVFLLDFEEIYVSHRTFDEIINSILYSNDVLVRKVWDKIRQSPKVTLIQPVKAAETFPDELIDIIGVAFAESCDFAKETDYLFCLGDLAVQNLCRSKNISAVGVLPILDRFLHNKKIDFEAYSRAKLVLVSENHNFVSFNQDVVLQIASNDNFNLTSESEKFFDYIFKISPDILSFVNVFNHVIIWLFKNNSSDTVICEWIAKFATTFCKLHQKHYIGEKFLSSNSGYDSDQVSKAFYFLLITVEVLSKDDSHKKYFYKCIVDNIKYANLYMIFHNTIMQEAVARSLDIKQKQLEQG